MAGAQLSRDQREPVELSTVISAAVSEVEDYRRVQIAGVPESTVLGAAVGSIIHLLAELIDNALRYSPPTTPVWVSSARGGDGGMDDFTLVNIEAMTDRRIHRAGFE